MCGFRATCSPRSSSPGRSSARSPTAAAAETGLAAGTPVVVGGADTQLALVGLGRSRARVAVGRRRHVLAARRDARPSADRSVRARLRTLCHAVPGQWMVEGIGFLCGLTMRWFRDAFCRAEVDEARRRGVDPYVVMEEIAATVPPGSNGVLGVFSNVMDARRWVHASPRSSSSTSRSPGSSGVKECIRAIEEAAAYVARAHIAIIEELVGTHDPRAGVHRRRLRRHAVAADPRRRDRHARARVGDQGELGARMRAVRRRRRRLVHDASTTRSALTGGIERTCEADPAARAAYDELFTTWQDTYRRSLELVEHGVLRPLWRPAGA